MKFRECVSRKSQVLFGLVELMSYDCGHRIIELRSHHIDNNQLHHNTGTSESRQMTRWCNARLILGPWEIAIVTQLLLLLWAHKNSWRFNFSLHIFFHFFFSVSLCEHCSAIRGVSSSSRDPHCVILCERQGSFNESWRVALMLRFSLSLSSHFLHGLVGKITFCNKLFISFLRFCSLLFNIHFSHYTIECVGWARDVNIWLKFHPLLPSRFEAFSHRY